MLKNVAVGCAAPSEPGIKLAVPATCASSAANALVVEKTAMESARLDANAIGPSFRKLTRGLMSDVPRNRNVARRLKASIRVPTVIGTHTAGGSAYAGLKCVSSYGNVGDGVNPGFAGLVKVNGSKPG